MSCSVYALFLVNLAIPEIVFVIFLWAFWNMQISQFSRPFCSWKHAPWNTSTFVIFHLLSLARAWVWICTNVWWVSLTFFKQRGATLSKVFIHSLYPHIKFFRSFGHCTVKSKHTSSTSITVIMWQCDSGSKYTQFHLSDWLVGGGDGYFGWLPTYCRLNWCCMLMGSHMFVAIVG